jgi:hypothetical protein
MIKRLLNLFSLALSHDYERKQIENYLARSSDLADLEDRMKELDKNGGYNRFYT